MPVQKINRKRQIFKTIIKGSTHSFYDFGRGSQRKRLPNDLKYLPNFNHTVPSKFYYSLYNKYCPKRLHFSYEGRIARSQLAVLDFNTGVYGYSNVAKLFKK